MLNYKITVNYQIRNSKFFPDKDNCTHVYYIVADTEEQARQFAISDIAIQAVEHGFIALDMIMENVQAVPHSVNLFDIVYI